MIKITKPSMGPQILIDNFAIWTSNLLMAVKKHGTYSAIPKEEKEKLLGFYRHEKIKEILFLNSFYKCAFCECKPQEGGNIEVEHFKPKSIYPELTFEWGNLLPICRVCNGNKSDLDTLIEPIINPTQEDPEPYLDFNSIQIIPSTSAPDRVLAERTINKCGLNGHRLPKPRADLLVNLCSYEQDLKSFIDDLIHCDTIRKKRNKINNLVESLERIDSLTDAKEKHSFFCKNYVNKSEIINRARDIINDFNNDYPVS